MMMGPKRESFNVLFAPRWVEILRIMFAKLETPAESAIVDVTKIERDLANTPV